MFEARKITDILQNSPFTRSVEIFPPRNGKPPSLILDKIERLSKMNLDFVSITKGAGGSHRGGTVPIGFMIGDRYGLNPLVHFRARDLSKRDVENHLVDHFYFGIKNILAVMGDPIAGMPDQPPDPETHHRFASDLVHQIRDMNRGRYMRLHNDPPDTVRDGVAADFCIGVASYPEREDMSLEYTIMEQKREAGADFGITQMCFDATTYGRYVDTLKDRGVDIPVIPGIRPVTRLAHVDAAERIFGAAVPPELKRKLEGKDEQSAREVCLDFTVSLCREMRAQGAPGVHLFILNDVDIAGDVLRDI